MLRCDEQSAPCFLRGNPTLILMEDAHLDDDPAKSSTNHHQSGKLDYEPDPCCFLYLGSRITAASNGRVLVANFKKNPWVCK